MVVSRSKSPVRQYALRVSTLPIADGEKIVMRILNESNQAITLEELGYWGHSLRSVFKMLSLKQTVWY